MTMNREQTPRKPIEHKTSNLLTRDENAVLVQIIGQRCQILASAVVQLYLTEAPQHSRWFKKFCGVACLIKDNMKQSYFIRIYDIYERKLFWEQEMYTQLKYKEPRPYFHMFEAEHCVAGLNFANEAEAAFFRNITNEKVTTKPKRNSARRSQTLRVPNRVPPSNGGTTLPHAVSMDKLSTSTLKKDKKNKSKIRKEDIGLPTNFQHVQHVGWDPQKGFDAENVDQNLRQFFNMAGVSETQLKDRETRVFIYDFIEKHGGFEAAVREAKPVAEEGPGHGPPVPPRQIPPPPSNHMPSPIPSNHMPSPIPSNSMPPPPPSGPPSRPAVGPTPQQSSVPPPPPSRAPPTKMQAPRAPPPPAAQSAAVAPPPPPPPPPTGSIAPPPPPPPPMGGPPPPMGGLPPPANGGGDSLPPADDPRSALMASIKSGTATLKPVKPSDNPRPSSDHRNDMLDQIRTGIQLKQVVREETPAAPTHADGLAGALARALKERSVFVNASDESSDEDEDDDDWSD